MNVFEMRRLLKPVRRSSRPTNSLSTQNQQRLHLDSLEHRDAPSCVGCAPVGATHFVFVDNGSAVPSPAAANSDETPSEPTPAYSSTGAVANGTFAFGAANGSYVLSESLSTSNNTNRPGNEGGNNNTNRPGVEGVTGNPGDTGQPGLPRGLRGKGKGKTR